MPMTTKNFSDIIAFTRTGSTATYFNSAGVLTTTVADEPRFDYNPATLAARGLLIEESRTNSIRNNTMQGAVAGTPGTQPTNWAIQSPNTGLTREIVGVGTQNGITYVDVRFSGTTTGTSANIIFPENNTFVAALNGQSWAASSWIALVGGSFTNITASNLILRFNDGAGSLLTSNSTSFLGATATQVRYATAGTASNASTAFVTTCIQLGFSNGVAIDITLRIGLPQLELGAFATSVIPTTTTALTRSADLASVNTLNPWFNATEGTLFAEWTSLAPNGAANGLYYAATLTDNAATSAAVQLAIQSRALNNQIRVWQSVTGGGLDESIQPSFTSFQGKAATNYGGAANVSASANGGAVVTMASPLQSSVFNTLQLGVASGLSGYLNGHIRRITYYPRRLSNAELQAITTP